MGQVKATVICGTVSCVGLSCLVDCVMHSRLLCESCGGLSCDALSCGGLGFVADLFD